MYTHVRRLPSIGLLLFVRTHPPPPRLPPNRLPTTNTPLFHLAHPPSPAPATRHHPPQSTYPGTSFISTGIPVPGSQPPRTQTNQRKTQTGNTFPCPNQARLPPQLKTDSFGASRLGRFTATCKLTFSTHPLPAQ